LQPARVTASSLAEALEHIDTDKTIQTIDFELLSYRTFYRGTVDEEWFLLKESRLEYETTEIEIRSKNFEVRQEYQFLLYTSSSHPHFNLIASLAFDKYKSKAVIIIDPSSAIPLKKGIQEYIKREIWNHKLRHGLLIGITDNNLDEQINRLLLKIQKEGPLKAPYKMNIIHFFPPIDPVNDSIVLHYKKDDHHTSLIEGVQNDDLIFEYIFAKRGSDGRSCKGEFVVAPEPIIRYISAVSIDHETIRAHEDEYSICFYAMVSGYVKYSNGIFSISQELRLKKASFRDTGSIEIGSDKEIHVKIHDKDNSKDAVGAGVNIDVQTLDVTGTIGSHTKIQACELTIGSQAHKKSLIKVQENATIHLHRGDLKAKNATIEILEAGKVEAISVHVSKMLGGEIIAEHVTIDTLYSNANITALKSITINSIVGDGNNLIIDPRNIPSYHEQIDMYECKNKELNTLIQQQGKELLGKELALKEQTNRIKQTQLKIKTALSQNQPPLKADMVCVQQYKFALATLQEEQANSKIKEEEQALLEIELEKLYDADIHATITHHGVYNGHTRITFIDPKTNQKHSTSPQGTVLHIRLRREGEDKKIIFES
jgi:hypothetical protein